MKKIIFYLLIFYIVYVIGLKVNYNNDIDFYIGDRVGKYYYFQSYNRFDDIMNIIEDNIVISDRKIQNILVKSNNIYINLNSFIIDKNSYGKVKEVLSYLRYYNKENIVIKLREEDCIEDKRFNMWILGLKDKYDIIIAR